MKIMVAIQKTTCADIFSSLNLFLFIDFNLYLGNQLKLFGQFQFMPISEENLTANVLYKAFKFPLYYSSVHLKASYGRFAVTFSTLIDINWK